MSAHGAVHGRFVSADGAVLGEPFVFQAVPGFGQFPQLAYSPDANGGNGGFLVTWHESDGAGAEHSCADGQLHRADSSTPDRPIVGNDTYHEIMGAPVAYSTVSREFLVVWRQYADVNIFGIRLNNNGDPISGAIRVAASTLFESDPSLTYNPATDEFLAVYRMGFGPTSVMAQRVKAGTGALVGARRRLSRRPRRSIRPASPTTHRPVSTSWRGTRCQATSSPAGWSRPMARQIGAVTPLSTRVGTYDSLSVDANEISGNSAAGRPRQVERRSRRRRNHGCWCSRYSVARR